jgi:hypothetical protein
MPIRALRRGRVARDVVFCVSCFPCDRSMIGADLNYKVNSLEAAGDYVGAEAAHL